MPEFLSSLLQMGSVVNVGITEAVGVVIIDVVLKMMSNNVVDEVRVTLRTHNWNNNNLFQIGDPLCIVQ